MRVNEIENIPAYMFAGGANAMDWKDVAENVNRSLNTLHNPKEYQSVLGAWEHYYGEGEGKARLDQYSQTVDAINKSGGTVYRAIWILPGERPRLENPGEHWTTSPELAEKYLESTAGHAALADLDNYDAVPYIISATVGPNGITNKNVYLAGFPDEFEVGLVNPKSAKIAIVKQVDNPFNDLSENFADGKGPGRPGDSQRHGIPKNATMAELEKASHAKGRKGQLARWQLNMRRGHKK